MIPPHSTGLASAGSVFFAGDKLEFSVRSNIADFSRTLSSFEKKQLPFATAGALNDTIADVRTQIVDKTWPTSVTVRNRRFAGVAFRRTFAKKTKLKASLYDALGRAAFDRQAKGATRRPVSGQHLAVPTANVRRTGRGVTKGQRTENLKRSFKIKTKSGSLGIYQRTGKKKIRLMYALPTAAHVRKSFRFYEDAERVATKRFGPNFVKRFNQAMRTAKL